MVVGDLITAYHSGYHRVVRFYNAEYGHKCPQVEYQTVLNSSGQPCKGKRVRSCHVDYCKVVDRKAVLALYKDETKAAKLKRDAILAELSN